MSTKIHGIFFQTDSTVYQVIEVYSGDKKIGPHGINSTKWVPFPSADEAAIFHLTDVGSERWLVIPNEIFKCYMYHSYKVCM